MTRRLAISLLMGSLALAGLASAALAHASLTAADPPAGGTLATTPYPLTATFDEELTPDGSSIVIESSAGATVASGTVTADDDKVMTADLPALAPGVYTVRWTAVTADDKAVERGTYTFTVASASPSGSPVQTPAPTAAPGGGGSGSGNDLVLALGLAGLAIIAVLAFIFVRGRR